MTEEDIGNINYNFTPNFNSIVILSLVGCSIPFVVTVILFAWSFGMDAVWGAMFAYIFIGITFLCFIYPYIYWVHYLYKFKWKI